VSDAEPRPAPADAAPDAPVPDDLPRSSTTRETLDGAEPGTAGEAEPEPEGTAFVQVARRRAPRYRAFVLTGIGLAALVSLVVAVVTPSADGYSSRQLFGFLLVSLGAAGAILGGLVAVLVERRR